MLKLPERPNLYSEESAQKEARNMQRRVRIKQANDYDEAEKLLKRKKLFVQQNQEKKRQEPEIDLKD